MERIDILIVGGGIAGAALAYALSVDHRVALLERETHCGYHATGRSVAVYSETYGSRAIRALTVASGPFLRHPPDGFSPGPILHPRGALHIARGDQLEKLTAALIEMQPLAPAINPLTAPECLTLVPFLRPDQVGAGILESGACDIDVDLLHQAYLRAARAQGAIIRTEMPVTGIRPDGDGWRVDTPAGPWQTWTLVNAAGAWADQVAQLAGVAPVGLEPRRRTVTLVEPPAGLDIARLPFVVDIDESFYFKPSAGMLAVSPADETLVEPADVQPEELDIASAMDRLQTACNIKVTRKGRSWAGLRSFVADRNPVIGFEPRIPGFFWLAALGGYGIQTAPAVAGLAASLIRDQGVPDRLTSLHFDLATVSPNRLRR
ncbi:FAD-dependent oxidoreductase [Niveispirillum sp. BGYR6]|uniref:NAD(P)/FAD-dependent oxidoreductase n=1 Tax=Niveispirillum sp. BGYR6 TaxID=2971249 RepID=UPI0022B97B3B|nr:FAD-dependent oxidoreductase [Niveispirillum sp. BGYR6]MDG5493575.1 FAD-dependent oxidoreductase [Niveispirillum sp. BGYR6]